MRWECALAALLTAASLGGCSVSREKGFVQQDQAEGSANSFHDLYGNYCSGCHGANGEKGPATDLANPVYQAIVDDALLRDVIANGQKGTMMPGFAKSAGGNLTTEQITTIVQGMRQNWAKPVDLGASAPKYRATLRGDVERGRQHYSVDCARCHGPEGGPPGKAGAILDGSFLGLVSDQTVRTTAIAGRPDLGMPEIGRAHV